MLESEFESQLETEKFLLELEAKQIRNDIKLMFKSIYLGTCFILILIPMLTIFRGI